MADELERLVNELLRKTPDQKLVREMASDIDDCLTGLEKKDIKKEMIEMLGCQTGKYKLSSSITNIAENFIYLKSKGMDNEDIRNAFSRFQPLFSLNYRRKLRPAYIFLRDKFHAEVKDIVSTPSYLGFSIKKRMQPRYDFLRVKRPEKHYKANVLLYSDESFCERLRLNPEEYQIFKRRYEKGSFF